MKKRVSLLLIIIVIFSIYFVACNKEPLKIGMIGSISGKQSQLSVDARNALDIAVNEVNKSGGINGQDIELVVKDDEYSVDTALKRHKEFIDEGVQLVVGHMTSNMSDAVLQSQSDELLFLSPSMSTEKLSNFDDLFLRTSPLTNTQGSKFIEYVLETNLENITVVYDVMNSDYSLTLSNTIKLLSNDIDKLDVNLIAFDSRTDTLEEIISSVDVDDVDCVYIIAQATDTAFIAQKLKQEKANLTLFSVSWSMTKDLIHNGGKYVEGMYFVGVYHSEKKSPDYIKFEDDFTNKFGYKPSFISILTYDSFNMLVEAIRNADDTSPQSIKKSLIEIEEFVGLEEIFKLNEYGDSNRDYLIYQLKDGEFIPLYN